MPGDDQRHPGNRDDATMDLGAAGAVPGADSSGFSVGAVFAGRYEMVARLGSGGTGDVYRARDRVANADVALKILHARGTEKLLDRLRRELRLVRELTHPGILRVHDLGMHGDRLFTVSKLLDGETLAERMARKGAPLSPVDAERLVREILEALAAAHDAGVVHRDVKPANVFLATEGASGGERVVLLDFGLARRPDDPSLTATGHFLGTPCYASPEQARGTEPPLPATDLYAVGVVLWEMLSGKPPFYEGSQVEILRAHMETPPPHPGRAMAGAPWRLRALALKLLEKDPARRPRDAAAALAWLDGLNGWIAFGRGLRSGVSRTRLPVRAVGATTVLAAFALGTAWLLAPVDVSTDGHDLVWNTRVGLDIRTGPFDTRVASAAIDPASSSLLPRAWVGCEAPPATGSDEDKFRWYKIVEIRYPLGSPPGHFLAGGVSQFPAQLYSGIPSPLLPSRILPLSDIRRSGEAALAVVSTQHPNWPTCVHLPLPDRELITSSHFWHPGYLYDIEPLRTAPDSSLTLVAVGFNNWSGPRPVALRIPASPEANGQAPPFVGHPERFGRLNGWYTFLPTTMQVSSITMTRANDALIVSLGEGRDPIHVDPDTGTPLRDEHRHGLSPGTWRERRHTLLETLYDASMLSHAGAYSEAADRLEAYARALPREPIMASVAAYRGALAAQAAARNLRDERAYQQALDLAKLSLQMDPTPQRVRLLAAELETRLGLRESAGERLRTMLSGDKHMMYNYECLLLNEMAGRPLPRSLIEDTLALGSHRQWDQLIACILAYLDGDRARVADALTIMKRYTRSPWDVVLYWSARWYLDAPLADPKAALEALDHVPDSERMGWELPLGLLRLRARKALGEELQDSEIEAVIEEELATLEDLAPTDLHAWYLLEPARRDAAILLGEDATADSSSSTAR